MPKISSESSQYREAVAAREQNEEEAGVNRNFNVFGAGLLRVLEESPDQEEAALHRSMVSFR